MQNQTLGIIFSLSAAFFWSTSVIMYRKSGDGFSPLSLNFFKSLIAIILLLPTLYLKEVDFIPDNSINDWLLIIISGILGTALADSLFFSSLNRIGASLNAIIGCSYLPCIIIFSYIFLDEALGFKGLIGGALVLSALFVSTWHGKRQNIDRKDLIVGIIYGLAGILTMVVGIIMIKGVLLRSDVVWVTLIRTGAALLGLLVTIILHPQRKKLWLELQPSLIWKWAVPASVGNYLALLFWLAGMKYTMVSLAAILNQLSAILIFILAAIFLKEKITTAKSIAVFLALSGAIIATR
ncbi:MAG: DMT family transporter [Deltaproteobacteria bacterium]|jgi:drug/metabolite transporter (DMT)-like permease|nr:DMT family transporter [Deltaproteobacteria bacterium]MBT4527673.1 DMT family transporter [Deltaproteobacteria bacterium]